MAPEGEVQTLLAQLRDDLGRRRLAKGFQTLDGMRARIQAIGPDKPGSGALLGLLAQWVDAGYGTHDILRQPIAAFGAASRTCLPLNEYLHIRMAEGVLSMAEENFDRAEEHFRFVQSLEDEIEDRELLAIACFWTGRCLRKTGRYDDAVSYTSRAEALALECGYAEMAAIMQVTRSWLAFQQGRLAEAVSILRHAEAALNATDDFLNRGNIQSAYGRIARRQGRYELALEYFGCAIANYRRGAGGHLQLARALLNLAFVKRLIALSIQKELDDISASRRHEHDAFQTTEETRQRRTRIEQLRSEARGQVEEALAIYLPRTNHHGIASSRINQAFLSLDAGDLELAAAESAEAFKHGEEKHDHIIMARARIVQCMVENARLEEQIGDPSRLRENAEAYARDAVAFARQTQNRRLLARAYVWQGLTFVAASNGNPGAARHCAEQASALLKNDAAEGQSAWDDLETLKASVLRAGPIDATLRAWTAGITGDKSFQDIAEEFARIVIPKVWEREGRKVSRVATRLSISPKKVRRILHAARVCEERPEGEGGRDGSEAEATEEMG